MSTSATCGSSHMNASEPTVRQLRALTVDFKRIAENSTLRPEQRYDLAMADGCYGRIQTLFKELDMDARFCDLSPGILGHDTCLHLIGEEISQKLNSLSVVLAEPA